MTFYVINGKIFDLSVWPVFFSLLFGCNFIVLGRVWFGITFDTLTFQGHSAYYIFDLTS